MNPSASARATPGLLRLVAGVHLDQQRRRAAFLRHRRRDRVGQPRPVQRLDHVGQPHRVARLVGLQPADDVQLKPMLGAQLRELRRRLLHAVLAEHGLTGRQRRAHRLDRLGLAHRDQRHVLRPTARLDRRVRRSARAPDADCRRSPRIVTFGISVTDILLLLDDVRSQQLVDRPLDPATLVVAAIDRARQRDEVRIERPARPPWRRMASSMSHSRRFTVASSAASAASPGGASPPAPPARRAAAPARARRSPRRRRAQPFHLDLQDGDLVDQFAPGDRHQGSARIAVMPAPVCRGSRDAREHAVPVAASRLAEQPHRGIPGTILAPRAASASPARAARRPRPAAPSAPARCAIEVSDVTTRSRHCHHRGRVDERVRPGIKSSPSVSIRSPWRPSASCSSP